MLAASMTLGNLAAFFQTSVKRLLAYSTISQVGYLLMPVAVGTTSSTALRALLFYLAAYAATNLAAFAVVAELPHARTIASYRGLAFRRPGLAAVLVVSLLGLVGTPPTGVFLGKLQNLHRRHRRRLRAAGRPGGRQHRRQPVLLPALAGPGVPAAARRKQG